jgi:hypothetical protein
MANAFKLTNQVAANALLKLLKNNMVWAKNVSTRYSEQFGNQKMSSGSSFSIRRPNEFVVSDGATFVNQDVVSGSAQVVIDKQKHIAITWQPTDQPLNADNLLRDSVLNGKMAQLAQQIESDIAAKALEFHNLTGTLGQTVNSSADFFKGPQMMDELAIPVSDRVGILPPADFYATASSFATPTYFGNQINDRALTNVRLPMIGNIQPYMAQTMCSYTTGTRADALINGASQNVNYVTVKDTYTQTLVIDSAGAAGATINAGDSFTIAGVFRINPRTKQAYNDLQVFTVLSATTTAGGGEDATVTISPPIIVPSGADETLRLNTAYQTVSAAPADDAVVTWLGSANTSYSLPILYHKDAIQLCFVPPTRPDTGEYSFATDPETGVTLRTWAFSDGLTDIHRVRCDVMYGITNYDRRLGVKLLGTA